MTLIESSQPNTNGISIVDAQHLLTDHIPARETVVEARATGETVPGVVELPEAGRIAAHESLTIVPVVERGYDNFNTRRSQRSHRNRESLPSAGRDSLVHMYGRRAGYSEGRPLRGLKVVPRFE